MAPRNVSPRSPAPQQSALADKLRAQREAAEKLAAQRVTAARERAEGRIATEPKGRIAAEPKLSTPPAGGKPAGNNRPKFSFADEPAPPSFQPKQGSNGLPPLMPPRPALGGDRAPGFSARTANYTPQSSGFRQEPPAGFRPIDPATGLPGRPATPPGRSYPPLGGALAPTLPTARRPAPPPQFDEPRHYSEEEEVRNDPRLTRSMARQRPAAEESDDVFEDQPAAPAPSRRKASAAEYNAAYREAEEGYEEPRRRSGGPWLLLFALLLAAVATGGIVWYYQTKIKPAASVGSGTSGETVPVVPAPQDPAKTAAETPVEQPAVVQPANKKQIYDRIVGDQEISGTEQLVPTEQTPVQPEPQAAGQDAQTGSELIPAPAGTQSIDDAEPLPLPPPPGEDGSSTQGQLDGTQVQPASTDTAPGETASGTTGSETIGSLVQKSATDTSAAGGTASAADSSQLKASDGEDAAEPEVKAVEAKKPAKKTAAKPEKKPAKAKAKSQTEAGTGEDPLVLVPPSQAAPDAGTTDAIDIGGGSVSSDGGTAVAPVKKKKTIFDLFKGDGANAGDTAAPEPQETQVASTTTASIDEPVAETKSQQEQATTEATGEQGYVAYLKSFRSQSEAQAEFGRLRGKYPDIVGSQQASISKTTVAGSSRFSLGVGPLASREEASKICGSLLASGERDCIVRKQ